MIAMLGKTWGPLNDGMTAWYEAKMFIEHASAVSSDALHVLVGVSVWVVAALVLRRSLSASGPWMILFALTLFNEGVDFWVERWPILSMQLGESAKDVMLSMALPTVLAFAIRVQPNLFRVSSGRRR